MAEYVGLDVLMKETAVSIRRDGKRIWRGKCGSDPRLIAEVIRRRAPRAARVVFETGPLSVWFYHALTAEGLPASALMGHAKAALDMAPNKTDAHDADGLGQLPRWVLCEVRVKGFDSILARTLVAARNRLVQITTELSNQIRGLMKTFGLVVPAGKGSRFEAHVRALLADQEGLAPILLPLLEAWRAVRLRAAELGRQLVASARPRRLLAVERTKHPSRSLSFRLGASSASPAGTSAFAITLISPSVRSSVAMTHRSRPRAGRRA